MNLKMKNQKKMRMIKQVKPLHKSFNRIFYFSIIFSIFNIKFILFYKRIEINKKPNLIMVNEKSKKMNFFFSFLFLFF